VELTLFYRGSLVSNGRRDDKQRLRRCFHEQLAVFWSQGPIREIAESLLSFDPDEGHLARVGQFEFAPLVLRKHCAWVALEVQMLRPGPISGVVGKSGDIDNQMKTLLDALAVPPETQLPEDDHPRGDESPFYCLLEDDSLVSDLKISVKELLAPTSEPNEVILLTRCSTRATSRLQNLGWYLHP